MAVKEVEMTLIFEASTNALDAEYGSFDELKKGFEGEVSKIALGTMEWKNEDFVIIPGGSKTECKVKLRSISGRYIRFGMMYIDIDSGYVSVSGKSPSLSFFNIFSAMKFFMPAFDKAQFLKNLEDFKLRKKDVLGVIPSSNPWRTFFAFVIAANAKREGEKAGKSPIEVFDGIMIYYHKYLQFIKNLPTSSTMDRQEGINQPYISHLYRDSAICGEMVRRNKFPLSRGLTSETTDGWIGDPFTLTRRVPDPDNPSKTKKEKTTLSVSPEDLNEYFYQLSSGISTAIKLGEMDPDAAYLRNVIDMTKDSDEEYFEAIGSILDRKLPETGTKEFQRIVSRIVTDQNISKLPTGVDMKLLLSGASKIKAAEATTGYKTSKPFPDASFIDIIVSMTSAVDLLRKLFRALK